MYQGMKEGRIAMGFLDSVTKFTSGVAEKTKGNVDVLSLNSQISGNEKEINELYRQLGANYYAAHKDDPEDNFKGTVDTITQRFATIEGLKAEIEKKKEEIAAVQLTAPAAAATTVAAPVMMQPTGKVCQKCGQPIGDELFCGNCGTKQEPVAETPVAPATEAPAAETPVTAETPVAENQAQGRVCSECGSKIDDDAVFCPNCGKKQGE